MRTRHCKAIGVATCESVMTVRIDVADGRVEFETGTAITTVEDLDHFARSDGFNDWTEMREFWRENHPDVPIFSGVMIRWRDFRETEQSSTALVRRSFYDFAVSLENQNA